MLKSTDLHKELKILEDKGEKATLADVVKVLCLISKMLRDVRSNQVLGMKKAGVKLIQPDKDGKVKPETK